MLTNNTVQTHQVNNYIIGEMNKEVRCADLDTPSSKLLEITEQNPRMNEMNDIFAL